MKKILFLSMSAVLLCIGGMSQAGMNYQQYREQFEASKQANTPAGQNQTLYHQSRYIREQDQAQGTMVQSLPVKNPGQINKYERSYWDPTQP